MPQKLREAIDRARSTGDTADLKAQLDQSNTPLARVLKAGLGRSSLGIAEMERAIGRAFQRSRKLAEEGFIVVILLDEADALVGNSEGRYEGGADRRRQDQPERGAKNNPEARRSFHFRRIQRKL